MSPARATRSIAVLTLALAAGIPAIALATQLANFAAGAVVEKLGTATATPAEIHRTAHERTPDGA